MLLVKRNFVSQKIVVFVDVLSKTVFSHKSSPFKQSLCPKISVPIFRLVKQNIQVPKTLLLLLFLVPETRQ